MIRAPFAGAALAALLLTASGLSGCARNCTGNPNTDGLGCSIANQGQYERDTQAAERTADDAAMDADAERRRNEQAQRDLAMTRDERQALQKRVKKAEREVALIEGQLRARRAALSDAQYELYQAEIARLRDEGGDADAQREVEELESDVEALKRIVEGL